MEWNIKELKNYGKAALKKNYWKTFFISSLLSLLSFVTLASMMQNSIVEIPSLIQKIISDGLNYKSYDNQIIAILITLAGGVAFLTIFFKWIINIFITNPIKIGSTHFMKETLSKERNGKITEAFRIFDHNYLNCVKVLFIYDILFTIASLLFIIPGIYFSYKYRLVPYLLDDKPDMNVKEAFSASAKIMNGYKWKALLLDLSFIPLQLLGILTFGFVTIFYTNPYKNLVDAKLYLKLLEKEENKE